MIDAGARTETDAGAAPAAPAETFDIAFFARIDRPAIERRRVDLADLVKLLTTFQELGEKQQAPCWSPTRYAAEVKTRGNVGVEAVSALVFDLDRVPPDPKRLESVYWIGHTTWSHRPGAPRWRVVIPLAQPVPATSWADVWQRARGALCPEADPACKDPSRAYWFPSHSPGVQPEKISHAGPLLDPARLPPLPRQPQVAGQRNGRPVSGDHRRSDAYMASVLQTSLRLPQVTGTLRSTAPPGH